MCGRRLGNNINAMDHCIASTCEDVKTVVFCLDCAEDIRDGRSLSVQQAEPHGPEATLKVGDCEAADSFVAHKCLNIHNQNSSRMFQPLTFHLKVITVPFPVARDKRHILL